MFQLFLTVVIKLTTSPEEPFVVLGRKMNEIIDKAIAPIRPKIADLLVDWSMYFLPSKLKKTKMFPTTCL